MKNTEEFSRFSHAMDTILKADPAAVKAAMEAEKKARADEARATGKRGRADHLNTLWLPAPLLPEWVFRTRRLPPCR